MSKILKNNTSSDILINDTGVSVLANSSYTIPEQDYILWAASVNVQSYLDSSDLIANDGTSDLSPTEGSRFLKYPDRITIQKDDIAIKNFVTDINFTGNVTVISNDNGKTTIDIISGSGTPEASLREVTTVIYPFGPLNVSSDLLFEVDLVNDTILFLKEV